MNTNSLDLPGLPPDPALLELAQRLIWFQPPERALADPLRLLAYAFQFGRLEDYALLRQYLSEGQLRQALDHAPPGIIDARSWCYWRLVLDLPEAPLPARFGAHSHSMVAGGLPEMS